MREFALQQQRSATSPPQCGYRDLVLTPSTSVSTVQTAVGGGGVRPRKREAPGLDSKREAKPTYL